MKQYLERMVNEYNDLQDKIRKLIVFILECEETSRVEKHELLDLKEQLEHMQQYKYVLERRLIKKNLIPKVTWQD